MVPFVVILKGYYVAWSNKIVPVIRRKMFSCITVNCRVFLQNSHLEGPNKSERTEIESDVRTYAVDANLFGERLSVFSKISEATSEVRTKQMF
jgi:hypothetical protein